MTPVIQENSYVIVKVQEDVESGEIAAVLVNGSTKATLKKVRKVGSTILLEAINEEYVPYILNKDNCAKVLGKVVKMLNNL